jgi:hypothetical protein
LQDLIFNNMHHFIGQNRVAAKALPTFDGGIAAMRKIKNENPGTALVLVGHGFLTGPAAIDETIIYFVKAKEVLRVDEGTPGPSASDCNRMAVPLTSASACGQTSGCRCARYWGPPRQSRDRHR